MATITAALVKDLREQTGAGMMDCKKALSACDGDMEKAVIFLRERGLAQATAKAGRIASEGLALACVSDNKDKASLVEVNSETDFVAKNEEFRSFVEGCAKVALSTTAVDVEQFLNDKFDDTSTVNEALTQKISTIGENLKIRRFETIEKEASGALCTYIHGGGKIAVVVSLACDKEVNELQEIGKNVAMQIAAMNPKYTSRDDIEQSFIESEKAILVNQAMQDPKNANKPQNVVEKIVEGRLVKSFKEICLLDQEYIKDSDLSISKYLEAESKQIGAPIKVIKFIRFAVGEGLEKKEENFAEEVSKAMGN